MSKEKSIKVKIKKNTFSMNIYIYMHVYDEINLNSFYYSIIFHQLRINDIS